MRVAEGTREMEAVAGDLNAMNGLGCGCSGCGGPGEGPGRHPRLVGVGCLFALRERGGCAMSVIDLMARWRHGGMVAGCCADR